MHCIVIITDYIIEEITANKKLILNDFLFKVLESSNNIHICDKTTKHSTSSRIARN